MQINNKKLWNSAHSRYRNAKIYALDATYTLVDRGVIDKAYSQFILKMRLLGLTMWLANKLDCDKWAWLFKGYITVRNALSKRANALPVGILCYNVDGDKGKPHCINTYIHTFEGGSKIVELEPQPRNGTKELTKAERDSAWLVIF